MLTHALIGGRAFYVGAGEMTGKNLNTFVGALPIIAKAIGRRYGVTVEVGGSRAYTNGKTIHLPALPVDDPEIEVLVNGYLDHEAAHCRFSDFSVERSADEFQQWVENSLEDIRIELAMGRCYPGCKRNLDKLSSRLVADGVDRAVSDEAGEAEALSGFILHRLRSEVLGQEALDDHAAKATERVESMFPKGLCTKLSATMAEVREARSTQDVIDLADRLVRLLKDEVDEPEKPDEPDGPEGDPKDQPNDQGDSQGSDQASGQSDDQLGDREGDQEGGQPGDQGDSQLGDEPGDQSSGQKESPGSGATGDEGKNRREALRKAMNPAAGELREDRGEQVARKLEFDSKQGDQVTVPIPSDEGEAGGSGEFAEMEFGQPIDEASVRQASAKLRARLAGLVQAEKLEHTARGRAGKRIDRRMLPRLGHADPKVFRVSEENESVDTAVTVLLDRSSSMASEDRIVIARETTLAMAYALNEVEGVNPSVFAFPGKDGVAFFVTTLHRRGQRVSAQRFGVDADGGTPLGLAAWYAGWDLLCADEARKILIVITDGAPNGRGGCVDVLKRMRDSGIEMVGLGIKQTIGSDLIPDSRRIDNIKELPTALFGLLEEKLVTELGV